MNLSLDSCGSKTILFCFLKKNPPMMQSSLCFSAEAKGWQLLSASLMFGEHKRDVSCGTCFCRVLWMRKACKGLWKSVAGY